MLMGIGIPSIAGLIGFLGFSNLYNVISIAVALGYLGFVSCMAIAILRYGLFIVSPATAAETIMATIPDAMILTTHKGNIISTNPAGNKLIGIGNKEKTDLNIKKFVSDGEISRIVSAITGRGPVSDEELIFQGECGSVPVSIAASEVRDPSGLQVGLVFIIRDITSRKASEHALVLAQEKLALINRITRHDITNLLTGLIGHLTIAEEKADINDHSLIWDIQVCKELSDRIADHIHSTAMYHDITSGNPSLQSLNELISRLEQEMMNTIRIIADIEPMEIFADPLIYKVFYNLAENSVRHGKTVSQITCKTEHNMDTIILSFEDDGCGIPHDEKTRIFEPGFGKNTGFGLSFCRDVLAYTGILIRECGTPGHGARFEIIIPPGAWRIKET